MAGETIAVFTKNRTNAAYEAARLGADRAAARHGVRTLHFVPDRPDDIEQQIALVRNAIAVRPAAVVFVPVHATALDESVRRLNEAGIPVVNYLNRLAAGRLVTFVGADDYRLARAIAAFLFRRLGGSGRVVMMTGIAGAVTSQERVRGFRDESAQWPGIRIVGERAGDYDRGVARSAMRELLAAHEGIEGVLSANDAMSLGVLDALESAGRRAAVIGVNALPDAIEAVKAGRLLATVDFDAMKISCIATEAALRHLRGQAVPAEILLPAQVVDSSNCQAWDRPLTQRRCPDWSEAVRTMREL
jgi:ribose transport system substrate-binding protein